MYFEAWDEDEEALYLKIKELNALRAQRLPLIYGTTEVELVNEGVLVFKRKYFDEEVYVVLNAMEYEQDVVLPFNVVDLQRIDIQNAKVQKTKDGKGIYLPPWGYTILSNQP